MQKWACSRFLTGSASGSVLPLYLTTLNLCYLFYIFLNVSKYDSSSVSGAIGSQEPDHETEAGTEKHRGSALVVITGRTLRRGDRVSAGPAGALEPHAVPVGLCAFPAVGKLLVCVMWGGGVWGCVRGRQTYPQYPPPRSGSGQGDVCRKWFLQGCFFWVGGTCNRKIRGLPWWLSGQESACQRGRHEFNPWSGNIPHSADQLSLCTTATEPVL